MLRATPCQLHALAFYPRKSGRDELRPPAPSAPPPPAEPSPRRDRAALEHFRAFLSEEKYRDAVRRLDEFWEGKGHG